MNEISKEDCAALKEYYARVFELGEIFLGIISENGIGFREPPALYTERINPHCGRILFNGGMAIELSIGGHPHSFHTPLGLLPIAGSFYGDEDKKVYKAVNERFRLTRLPYVEQSEGVLAPIIYELTRDAKGARLPAVNRFLPKDHASSRWGEISLQEVDDLWERLMPEGLRAKRARSPGTDFDPRLPLG